MLRLRTLGSLEITDASGRDVSEVLSRTRRSALLAYLALQCRGGYVRRDTLLPIFWPDLDQARARGSLRQALYVIRQALGDAVISSRGTDEVGISGEQLSCDVCEFEDALARGEPEQALALYRGALLDGFFIPDAPEFELWLERERARLRDCAATAARAAARRARARGDTAAGVRFLRTALELAPADESAVRDLMGALDAAGDRAGAVQAYLDFAQRLHREFDLEPSAETTALLDELRERPAPAPRPNRSTPPIVAAAAWARLPRRRRRAALLAGAGVLAAMAGIAMFARGDRIIPAATSSEPRLLIMPFTTRGDSALEYLGEGMADMLATSLDGPGLYRAVDPGAVQGFLEAATGAQSADELGRAAAKRFEAAYFVTGSVVEAGGRVRVQATLFAAPNAAVVTRAAAEADTADLFRMVDQISARLLVGAEDRIPSGGPPSAAGLTTESLPALKAYLAGERAMRAGEHADALAAFQRATAADTSFALAHYRLSMAAEWLGRDDLSREAAALALRQAGRLAYRDRVLLQAHHAMAHGAAAEAEAAYRSLLAVYPEDGEAWLKLGEVLFHNNPPHGRPIDEARNPFGRVLELDPDNATALQHLVRIAAFEGKLQELDSLLTRMQALPASSTLESRVIRAAARGDVGALAQLAAEVERAGERAAANVGWVAEVFARNTAAAERLLRLNTIETVSRDRRAAAHVQLAAVAWAHGRWRTASWELDRAAALDPAAAAPWRAQLALTPHVPLGAAALQALQADLEEDRSEQRIEPSVPPFVAVAGAQRQYRSFLRGALAVKARQLDTARRELAWLGQHAPAGEKASMGAALAQQLRAEIALHSGDSAQALRALEAIPVSELAAPGQLLARGAQRFALANLLAERGRPEQALRWYGSFGAQSLTLRVFEAPAELQSAELRERRGQPREAARHYERFLVLWEGADPELQPLLARARARLAALRR